MQVIVTGSLGFDYIMDFPGRFADRIMPDNIHKLSLSFLVDKLSKQFGGVAGNIAYTLKLLGVDPLIVACVGNDFAPYKTHLNDHQLSTKWIKEFKNESCSLYSVVTDQDDNQIGSYFVGAMKHAKELSLQDIVLRGKTMSYENFVVISPTDPKAMIKYVKECRSLKIRYLYDPAFQIATFSPEELKEGITGAALFIGNDYEISLVENRLGISHDELLAMAPVVITTLGAKGSIIETRKEAIHVAPAKPKNTSDPTGAGDAYRGGFLAGYIKALGTRPGLEVRQLSVSPGTKLHTLGTRPGLEATLSADELLVCGQMGSVAAVYTVETYGTQTHAFTKKEFAARYKANFGLPISL
ncbi:MAG: PfkB family carbohydrate kinase [Candidatus Gottesmanbacteria bacterium]|nr:PfkB family carbohydrate kinase [Candidatus Gottesmanbacteria bacterium]